MNPKLKKILSEFAQTTKRITVLTGAGISAESGIPTFRGQEGYWSIGSKEYHPQEMATYRMFMQKPNEVWKWYLYRMNICSKAKPNPGHMALVEMEKLFQDRFILITQNVDSLHLRAGNSLARTYQIHGNIFFMRCVHDCSSKIYPLPKDLPGKKKGEDITGEERKLLKCPDCGKNTRPHVLWFDEAYNEKHYHFHSSLAAAAETGLLLIVGTSGTTNLPNQVAWEVKNHNGIIIDINIEENTFTSLALSGERGFFIKQASGTALPSIMEVFKKCIS
ncbi:MAG: RNA polymerase subunit sigma [Deltaproteobacteria bacterium]|nr:RNA polymerase subunit sigma [Deltaproteobacteria bacterium]